MKDWNQWILKHREPKVAQNVFDWLLHTDADEYVWRAADDIARLILQDREQQESGSCEKTQLSKNKP